MEFKKVKLKDIGTIVTGCTPSTKKNEYYETNEYMFVGPTDLKKSKYVKDTNKKISNKAYKDYKNRFIEKNSIMIDCIGSDMGNVSISIEKVLTNQQINSLSQINTNEYNIEYVYYILSTMKEYFHKIGMNGSTMPIINKTMFENIEIEIPNKTVQDKVVKILSIIDRKIELNNEINDNLSEYIKKLYKEKIINSTKNTKVYYLEELINVTNGYSYTGKELVNNSNIGMVTIKNFERQGGFKIDGFKSINPLKSKEKHFVKKFDVLVACTDLTQNADIIGNPIILLNFNNYEKIIMSMDLVKVESKVDWINNYFLYSILNSEEFKHFALGYKTGTTVLHLNKDCFKEYQIALPNIETIKLFSQNIENTYKLISVKIEENIKLEQLRDTLLPKLMNGEINLDKI